MQPSYKIVSKRKYLVDLREVWSYRSLIWLLAWRSLRVRYKQTMLGFLWAILGPISFTALFVVFFKLVHYQSEASVNYVPSIFLGMIMWQFFSRGISEAGVSLTANTNLITKVYFPRLILPLATIVAAFGDFIITALIFVVVLIIYKIKVSVMVIFLPLFIIQIVLLVLSIGLIISAFDGLYRDLRYALPLVLQIGMFLSPVGYETSELIPVKWRWLYMLNPTALPIEGAKWSVFGGNFPFDYTLILHSIIINITLIIFGIIFFSHIEDQIVDRV